MLSTRIEKVETVFTFADGHGISIRSMLQDELFEVEESALVVDLLSYLDDSSPCIFRCETGAVWTLSILDDELDLKHLLQYGRSKDLGNAWDQHGTTGNVYRNGVEPTSFCTVSFTRNLLECGSVQTKPASTSLTSFNPFSFLRQMARSSLLSSSAINQAWGGDNHLEQFLQKDIALCFGMDSVMSTLFLRQFTQRFALLGAMGVPQSAQRMYACWSSCPAGAVYAIPSMAFVRPSRLCSFLSQKDLSKLSRRRVGCSGWVFLKF
jgi:hypothetical protein